MSAVELLAVPVPSWSDAFPRELTAHFLELARAEFDSATYDHARWFYDRDPTLPRWTGIPSAFAWWGRTSSDTRARPRPSS